MSADKLFIPGICVFYARDEHICVNVTNSDGCFIYYFEAPSMSYHPDDHIILYEDIIYFMKYAVSGGFSCTVNRSEVDPIGKLAEISIDIRDNVRFSITVRIIDIQRLEIGDHDICFPWKCIHE